MIFANPSQHMNSLNSISEVFFSFKVNNPFSSNASSRWIFVSSNDAFEEFKNLAAFELRRLVKNFLNPLRIALFITSLLWASMLHLFFFDLNMSLIWLSIRLQSLGFLILSAKVASAFCTLFSSFCSVMFHWEYCLFSSYAQLMSSWQSFELILI